MEMRAIEDIGIGHDLTPPLRPLAAVLHHSALTSHCSSCFSTLPPLTPFSPSFPQNPHHVPTLFYCSPRCSSLHFSSAEHHLVSLFNSQSPPSTWDDSSDLRLALRLLHVLRKNTEIFDRRDGVLERISGLMTNRERFDDQLERIKEGAKMIAKAREISGEFDDSKLLEFELVEMVLCLVLTNAVEVQDKRSGCSIGIAVYDTTFSWINHSCSPNACYRFLIGPEYDEQSSLKIISADGNGRMMEDNSHFKFLEGNEYGPRVVVRSIKAVKKGEEVTIAYTDLLQPKEMRQTELWSKYRFHCTCKRCDAVPTTYVDYALQALFAANLSNPDIIDQDSCKDYEIEKLMESFDDAITDYFSNLDPKSCCKKLENLIIHGHKKLKPHPLHHLSLNAYTTLASAYKVQASDLLALNHDTKRHKLEIFGTLKKSVAYSLLLAGAAHYLFMFESSLVASVANFWINAGEILLTPLVETGPASKDLLQSFFHYKCDYCCLGDTFEANFDSPDGNIQLDEIKIRMFNCINSITSRIWSILASGSDFLRLIRNPIDFSWLESSESVMDSGYVAGKFDDQARDNVVLLSVHCLRYGAMLSRICYGSSVEMYNKILSRNLNSGDIRY